MKVGFIDYYLDEYHANNYPAWLKEATGGELEVAYTYAKIDSPNAGGLTTAQWCEKYGIEEVSGIAELIEKSDCINVLSPDNPEMHEELCELALQSGKRVYIDKTFAETKEIAERIFAVAHAHHTPCFSSSALRFADEYSNVDRASIQSLVSYGPGPLDTYSIHQIEPLVALMGPDVRRVMYAGTANLPLLVMEWTDGRRAAMSQHGWECPFGMQVDKKDGTTENIVIASDYFGGFIREMADFFLHGEVKVPHEETIAIMSVREAAVRAAECPDTWVGI